MRILITGVAGFIGSALARKFIDMGYSVIGLDDLSSGDKANVPDGVDFFRMDVATNEFANWKTEVDAFFHFAGQSSGEISFDDSISDLNRNSISTLRVCDWCRTNGVEVLFFASSMSVYGDCSTAKKVFSENDVPLPLTPYGVSKLAAENYLRILQPSQSVYILRLFNIFGYGQNMENLRQGMVSIYLAQACKNKKIIVKGPLNRKRDLVHVDDAVTICALLLKRRELGIHTLNIGTGIAVSVREIIQEISKYMGPLEIEVIGGTRGDQMISVADNSALMKIVDHFSFRAWQDGIADFISKQRIE